MTTAEALIQLGIDDRTLSATMRQSLDEKGYMLVPGVLPKATCDRMRARLDELASIEGASAGKDFHTENGTVRLGSLMGKDPMFDICFLHPLVLASIARIAAGREFGLSSLTSRTALPGQGHQHLHVDFAFPSEKMAANALWLIDDFTADNGPTRLVPGSNRPRRPLQVDQPDWNASMTHPDEIKVIAPAGTLVVIDAFTWHGGTTNQTTIPRHLISAYFSERDSYQNFVTRTVPVSTWSRLSESARYILDYQPVG